MEHNQKVSISCTQFYIHTILKSTIRYFVFKSFFTCKNPKNLFLTKEQKLKLPMKKRWILTFSRWMKKKSKREKTIHLSTFLDVFLSMVLLKLWIFAEKQYQEKNYDSKSLQTFKRWSFSDDFTVETDDEAQISLWKDKICAKHTKWVYFFSWIKEEYGVLDTLMHTHLTLKLTFFCHCNRHWSFL